MTDADVEFGLGEAVVATVAVATVVMAVATINEGGD